MARSTFQKVSFIWAANGIQATFFFWTHYVVGAYSHPSNFQQTSEVSQGSVLAQMLFLIYTNDLLCDFFYPMHKFDDESIFNYM